MNEIEIIQQLRNGDLKALRAIIQEYSEDMIVLAYYLLSKDNERAVSVVDDILIKLFDPAYVDTITPPIHAHLFAEVRRACGY